jgi:hypothetical protein
MAKAGSKECFAAFVLLARRAFVGQPRGAAQRLPWVCGPPPRLKPQRGFVGEREPRYATPSGLKWRWGTITRGSGCAATPGFPTEALRAGELISFDARRADEALARGAIARLSTRSRGEQVRRLNGWRDSHFSDTTFLPIKLSTPNRGEQVRRLNGWCDSHFCDLKFLSIRAHFHEYKRQRTSASSAAAAGGA